MAGTAEVRGRGVLGQPELLSSGSSLLLTLRSL